MDEPKSRAELWDAARSLLNALEYSARSGTPIPKGTIDRLTNVLGAPAPAEEAVGLVLRRVTDWRFDKAIEHVMEFYPLAQTSEQRAFVDRFHGWLLSVQEAVALMRAVPRRAPQGAP